jgi:UDP-glucose-4-epimerase GalE
MGRTVLVSGGAGYIGSHMCRMLLQAGHSVIVLDNLARGHAEAVAGAELVAGDLRSQQDIANCLSSRQFDAVMHFAALAYVGESVVDPAAYYDNNVIGSINLLSAMRRTGLNRIVFSSTCATYGEPQEVPISESHPQQPVNPYGKTKLFVEHALRDHAEAYGLKSVSLRYFNAAGCDPSGELGERHDPETHLIPLVLIEALRLRSGGDPADSKLRVFGGDFDTPDRTCIRDYIHVNDLCSAHLLALDRLMEGKVAGAEAYNLGNGQGFSVLEVIAACRRVTGQEIQYRIVDRRAGDPGALVGSADRARDVLGWRPAIASLDDIVASAWNWFSKQPGMDGGR